MSAYQLVYFIVCVGLVSGKSIETSSDKAIVKTNTDDAASMIKRIEKLENQISNLSENYQNLQDSVQNMTEKNWPSFGIQGIKKGTPLNFL